MREEVWGWRLFFFFFPRPFVFSWLMGIRMGIGLRDYEYEWEGGSCNSASLGLRLALRLFLLRYFAWLLHSDFGLEKRRGKGKERKIECWERVGDGEGAFLQSSDPRQTVDVIAIFPSILRFPFLQLSMRRKAHFFSLLDPWSEQCPCFFLFSQSLSCITYNRPSITIWSRILDCVQNICWQELR